MNPRFSLLLIFSFTLGISCSSFAQKERRMGKKPDWVQNPSSEYNPKTYLLTVGSGRTLQDAQNHALGKLAHIFQSKVKADQKLINEFKESSFGDRMKNDRITQLLSVTEIGSRQNLINAKILKSYVDNSGTYYVLAGMQRRETARLYSAEISRNKLLLDRYEHEIHTEKSQLRRLALIKKAFILAKVNENLKEQRDILLGKPLDDSERQTRIHLEKEFRNLRKQSFVYLDASDLPGRIEHTISQILRDEGFTITPRPGNAIIRAKINYTFHQTDLKRRDAHFVRWLFTIQMIDNRSGDRLKKFTLKGRDGGLSHQGAVLRSQQTLQLQIDQKFKSFLEEELLKIN